VVELAFPKVKVLDPKLTDVFVTPLKDPIVVAVVTWLTSNVEVPFTVTVPDEESAPLPERARVPALIVVPLSYVLLFVSVKVPPLIFVKEPPVPERTPLKVIVDVVMLT
jgi:hypothetical protein